MTFFSWTPSGNEQIISPWVALYFALTVITTAFTIWFWNRRRDREDRDAEKQFAVDLEAAKNFMDIASLKRFNSGTQATEIDELETETKTLATP